jgi:hypothetical protein
MAGRSCREAVDRVPSTRAVLAEEEELQMRSRGRTPFAPLAVAVMEGDVEALEWLMQLFDVKGLEWRGDIGFALSWLAAGRGKIESLMCLRTNRRPWNDGTRARAAGASQLEVLQWLRGNGCPRDEGTCSAAAGEGHLEVLQRARQNGCPRDRETWDSAHPRRRPCLIERGCPGAE